MKNSMSVIVNGRQMDEQVFDTVLLSLPDETFTLFKNIEEYIFERKLLERVIRDNNENKLSFTSENINIGAFSGLFAMNKKNKTESGFSKIDIETIYENAVFAGIVTGLTKKNEVVEIMKKYSSFRFKAVRGHKSYYYEDIGLIVYYDDNETVKELTFDHNFRGQTSRGLRIGDHIDKAVELYGQPLMKSSLGAIWDNMAVFIKAEIITSIRIQG